MAPEGQWRELAEALAPFRGDLESHWGARLAGERTRGEAWLWAALAHDWGKAAARTVDPDGRIRFFNHEALSADLVEERLRALAFANDEIAYVATLAAQHMRPGHLAGNYPPSARALYRLYRSCGDLGPDVALLAVADKLASHAASPDPGLWENLLALAATVLDDYFRQRERKVAPPPLLDGRQLMAEFGVAPGPALGKLIEGLREAQAVGKVESVDGARDWVRRRLRAGGGERDAVR